MHFLFVIVNSFSFDDFFIISLEGTFLIIWGQIYLGFSSLFCRPIQLIFGV